MRPLPLLMKKVKLIVFDLDGTLVDAYPAITRSFNRTMREFGYSSLPAAVIRRAVGWGDKLLLEPFVGRKRLGGVLAAYRRHHRADLLRHSRLIGGAAPMLAALRKQGIKLAVATNRPTVFTRIIVRHLKIDRYLDYVLCADRLRYRKPHPEILRRIMRRFRACPDETIFVGDMCIDARCARNAGIRAVMVTTGSHTRKELAKEKPWRIMRSVSSLTGLLL